MLPKADDHFLLRWLRGEASWGWWRLTGWQGMGVLLQESRWETLGDSPEEWAGISVPFQISTAQKSYGASVSSSIKWA